MGSLLNICRKALEAGAFVIRHFVIVAFACFAGTIIGVFIAAIVAKGFHTIGMANMGGVLFFTSFGMMLMSPALILAYLPASLLMWRFRMGPISFVLVGSSIASLAGIILFGNTFKLEKIEDYVSFASFFTTSGALTGLFHFILLARVELLFPSLGRIPDETRTTRVARLTAASIVVAISITLLFQAFAPKKVKESCFRDITVSLGAQEILVPRKYWVEKENRKDSLRRNSTITSIYADEEWRPMPDITRKCNTTKIVNAYKVFLGSLKLTDSLADPYGPAWYNKRLSLLEKADIKLPAEENMTLQSVPLPVEGKTLLVLPVMEVSAAESSPIIVECTEPDISHNTGEKIYNSAICYTNYRHETGIQIGYKMFRTPENLKNIVSIHRQIQKQIQIMWEEGRSWKLKSSVDLKNIPDEHKLAFSQCKNTIAVTIAGNALNVPAAMLADISIKDKPTHQYAGPAYDCSIERIENLASLGDMDKSFMLSDIDKKTVEHYRKVGNKTPPEIPDHIPRTNDKMEGMVSTKLPFETHPTLNGEPVRVNCMGMSRRCHIRYMHPLGFWVTYIRPDGKSNMAETDLAIRKKIEEMVVQ